jgi:DNA-binding transcriptional LysR family regulator
MELNHLKYFYVVAKNRSFTKASKELRVSQPSISKIVKQLEDREGIRLLDRARRSSVNLTEMGKLFYASCEIIFGEVSQLKNQIALQSGECTGPLLIGASDNICNYILPGALEPFLEKHPKVSVKIFNGTSDEIKQELQMGKSELGVFHSPVNESSFESEKIAFSEFVIVCSPRNKALLRSGFDIKVLEQQVWISPRISDYAKPVPILRMLNSLGIKPKFRCESNSQETQKNLAMKNVGYAVVPKYMAQEAIQQRRLKVIHTPKQIGSDVYLVRRKNRTLSAPALKFQECLYTFVSRHA